MIHMPMKKKVLYLCLFVTGLVFGLASCSEQSDTFDKYADWKSRNALYFRNVADTAQTEIAKAKASYGDQWEEHCDWRMFRSLAQDPDLAGSVTDSILVRVMSKGTGKGCPMWTDTVRIHYRGLLMPARDIVNGKDTIIQDVFESTFTPPLNLNTAFPVLSSVSSLIDGFSTALQYMYCGDYWRVYIPQNLGYGSNVKTSIPAYSTLIFDLYLVDYFAPGSGIPDWN